MTTRRFKNSLLSAIIVLLTVPMATSSKLHDAYSDITYQCYTNQQCAEKSWVTNVYDTIYCCKEGDAQNLEAFGEDGSFLGLQEMLLDHSNYFGSPSRTTPPNKPQHRIHGSVIRRVKSHDTGEDGQHDATKGEEGEEKESEVETGSKVKDAGKSLEDLGQGYLKAALDVDDTGNVVSEISDQALREKELINDIEAKYHVLNKREVPEFPGLEKNPVGFRESEKPELSQTAKVIKPKISEEEEGEESAKGDNTGFTTKSFEMGKESDDTESETESRETGTLKVDPESSTMNDEDAKDESSAPGKFGINQKNIRPQSKDGDEMKDKKHAETDKLTSAKEEAKPQTGTQNAPMKTQSDQQASITRRPSQFAAQGRNPVKPPRRQNRVVCTCGANVPMHFTGPLNIVQKIFNRLWNFAAPMLHIARF